MTTATDQPATESRACLAFLEALQIARMYPAPVTLDDRDWAMLARVRDEFRRLVARAETTNKEPAR